MYEGACRLMAKQKVALDCLSYHAAASDEDTDALAKTNVPPATNFLLDSYKFNDMDMSDDDTLRVTLRMFMDFGLINQFQIPYRVSGGSRRNVYGTVAAISQEERLKA